MRKRAMAAPGNPGKPVFPIACWALGLIVFGQLLVAGMALAVRWEHSREVRIVEKEVPKLVTVRIPAAAPEPPPEADSSAVVSRPPVEPIVMPEVDPLPAPPVDPTPLMTPSVADPRAERLLREARAARVAGDMCRAIIKLEEASKLSPEDASVLYELGQVHEDMGVFDTAAEYYEKVFGMSIAGAGSLYQAAAAKLRDGFERPVDLLRKLTLGHVRTYQNPNAEGGEEVVLSIPVQKSPEVKIDPAKVSVTVIFFNRSSKGEITQLESEHRSQVTEQWPHLPVDWETGEETLQMTYQIPLQDEQTQILFGKKSYYGQVVTLYYDEEVMDVKAWPGDLAARISPPAAMGNDWPVEDPFGPLPPDFDPSIPLLPVMPR